MIYSQRSDGLGTRILSAIYAQMLSDYTGVPMGLIWTPLGWPFLVRDTPLMHPTYILEIFESLHVFRDRRRGAFGAITLHEARVSTELLSLSSHDAELANLSIAEIAQISMMGRGVNYDFPGPLFRFMTDDRACQQKFARLAASLNWHPLVLDTIGAIDRSFRLDQCWAVHVRRGDIVDMLFKSDLGDLADGGMTQILQRYTPLQSYFDAVDQHSGGIVVCTEDDGVVEAFKDRYGAGRIASGATLLLSENQRAVVDLVLLSKSRKIVAPVLSYFSQCAALIGNTALQNTAWHLQESTREIARLVAGAEPARAQRVRAILYAAAHALSRENKLDSASYYEDLMGRPDST